MKNYLNTTLTLKLFLAALPFLAISCGSDDEEIPPPPVAPAVVPAPAPAPAPLPQIPQSGDYVREQVIPAYQATYGNIVFHEAFRVIGNNSVLIQEIPAGPHSWLEIYDNVVVKLAQSGCSCYSVDVAKNYPNQYSFWLGLNWNTFNGYIGGYANSWISNTVTFERAPTMVVDIYSVVNFLISNAYSVYGSGGYYFSAGYTVPFNVYGAYYGGGYYNRPYVPGTYIGGGLQFSQGGGSLGVSLDFSFSKTR
jgi:hypothetical protein